MVAQDPTKSRLLEGAGEEFAEKGFELARVRAICDRAGANLAAINYHFGDKEHLYVEVLREAHRCGLDPRKSDSILDCRRQSDCARSSTISWIGCWP